MTAYTQLVFVLVNQDNNLSGSCMRRSPQFTRVTNHKSSVVLKEMYQLQKERRLGIHVLVSCCDVVLLVFVDSSELSVSRTHY